MTHNPVTPNQSHTLLTFLSNEIFLQNSTFNIKSLITLLLRPRVAVRILLQKQEKFSFPDFVSWLYFFLINKLLIFIGWVSFVITIFLVISDNYSLDKCCFLALLPVYGCLICHICNKLLHSCKQRLAACLG